jgi:uncharacterized membrane protein YgcG
MRVRAWWLLPVLVILAGCGGAKSQPYDPNTSVPKGDPAFPPLGDYWVIDRAGVLSADTVEQGDATCQKLQDDRIAEVVVVVMKGVKQPDEWATHYGRWLKLGTKGFSTEGGNRGVVWLIRPDAPEKTTISVGRGLPEFTTVDYGKIMDHAKDYLDFGNYDRGVSVIVQETDQALRRVTAGQGDH